MEPTIKHNIDDTTINVFVESASQKKFKFIIKINKAILGTTNKKNVVVVEAPSYTSGAQI